MRARGARGLLTCLAAIALLTGCGSANHEVAGNTIRGHVLTIYTSLPLLGPSAPGGQAVLDGERLALGEAHDRIGQYTIKLHVVNDASVAREGWDPGLITQNVNYILQDATTIAYVGDFNSGASAVAIPLLNRTGMLVLSPTSTAVGLTTASLAASPGEPDKYYPTNKRTFVRLAPDDLAQAQAQVRLQRSLGCTSAYVLNDGEFDGHDAAAAFSYVARSQGLRVLGTQAYEPTATDYSSLALSLAQTGASCVLIAALPQSHAALLARQVGQAMPQAHLFATSALAQPSFTDPDHGGIPLTLDSRVFITAPAVNPSLSDPFDASFAARYGAPDVYAAYGYEAMRLVLDGIIRATDGGRHTAKRSAVLSEVMGQSSAGGPLGTFRVNRDGTTSLRTYGVFGLQGGSAVLQSELR